MTPQLPRKNGTAPVINNKVFYRSVAALVVPIALQNLINVGVNSADVLMLGRVNEVVLGAASLAGQVPFVMLLLFFGLSSGASVLTAQYWGRGDKRTISIIAAMTLRISFVAGIVFAAAALFIPGTLMHIFTSDPELIAYGSQYLRFVAPSFLFMAFTNIYLTLLRSLERVVISTLVYLCSFVTNVCLNAILIFGLLGAPAMGIAGAALATTCARALELVIVIIYAGKTKAIRLYIADFFAHHKLLFKDFMKYSLPTILNELFWGMAIAANSVIIGHLGAQAAAASSVGQVMRQLATVICFGIAAAASVMVGKALGAGEPDKAFIYAKKLLRIGVVFGVLGGGVVLLIRPLVLHVMDLSPLAAQYVSFLLLWMAIYVVAQAYVTILVVGIFRAGGDTRFGLFIDVIAMWCGSILFGALAAFVFHWPVEVVFMIILADEFIKIPFVAWRFRSKIWLKDVTRQGAARDESVPDGEELQ